MSESPQRLRRIAFWLIVVGFLAELFGVWLLSAGERTPLSLAVMVVGVILVVVAVSMMSAARGPR